MPRTLQHIIEHRIRVNTNELLSLINKIAVIGPANATVLDTEKGLIRKDENHLLVIDETLIPKIKFIREGYFSEKEGASTLKLVGEVHPMDSVEIIKTIQQNIIDRYPFSYSILIKEIKKHLPDVKQNMINTVIKENNLKSNQNYSAYNFRFKHHEKEYIDTGIVPNSAPSIYNQDAIEFIVKVLE